MTMRLIPHSVYTRFVYTPEGGIYRRERLKMRSVPVDINVYGWVYCADCMTPLFTREEALRHAEEGHLIAVEFMPDEAAPEEIPAVD